MFIRYLILFMFLASQAFAYDYTKDPRCQIAYLLPEGSGTTTADATGNGNTGTFNSSGHPSWSTAVPAFNVYGSAANSVVSDATSYINTGNSAVVQNGNSMTIVMWFYETSLNSAQPNNLLNVNGNIIFGIDNVSTDLVVRVTGSTNLLRDSNTSAFSANTWTWVAYTWDGSVTAANVHIYTATAANPTVTEVSYATTTNGISLTSNAGNNAILLNRIVDAARPFLGSIAQPAIFNTVLPVSDMQNIVNYGLRGTGGLYVNGKFVANNLTVNSQ